MNFFINFFFQKSKTAIRLLAEKFLIFLSFPFCMIIILISPYCLIRFGFLSSSRVGTFHYVSEIYLAEKKEKINITKIKNIDLFYFDRVISNYLIASKIKQLINVLPRLLVLPFHRTFIFLSSYSIFFSKYIIRNHNYFRDSKYLIEKHCPFIKLDKFENDLAKQYLKKIHLNKKKIAVFIVRDSAYLDSKFPATSWKDDNLRNDNVNNYIKSMNYLADNGYMVFRMGRTMSYKIKVDHPNIIDYAFNKLNSELLDFYLMANCDICISSDTGIDCISDLNQRPMGSVQFPLSWVKSQKSNAIFIPRKILNIKSNRFLTLIEMFQCDVVANRGYENLYKQNLQIVPSDENDILNLTIELHKRLNKNFIETETDMNMQNIFWNIFFDQLKLHKDAINHDGTHKSKISSLFLRNNQWFLK